MKLTSNEIKWRDGMNYAYIRRNQDAVFEQVEELAATPFTNFYIVEREPIKTVVDAVNYYHGKTPIGNLVYWGSSWHSPYSRDSEDTELPNHLICTKEEFNQCVKEMSEIDSVFQHPKINWYKSGEKQPLTKENSDYSYYWLKSPDLTERVGKINKDTLESIKELDETQERINGLNYIIKQLHEALELKQCAIELLKSANKPKKEKRWLIYNPSGKFLAEHKMENFVYHESNQVIEIEVYV